MSKIFFESIKVDKRNVRYRLYACDNKGYKNIGYAKTLSSAKEVLFKLKGYEKYMVIEEDLENNCDNIILFGYYNELNKDDIIQEKGEHNEI